MEKLNKKFFLLIFLSYNKYCLIQNVTAYILKHGVGKDAVFREFITN